MAKTGTAGCLSFSSPSGRCLKLLQVSPLFKLLYGRPLNVLKESWEGSSQKEGMNLVAYVLKMKQTLEEMTELTQENLRNAQRNQKSWYDRTARSRSFQPGQQVLLLLPTSENKLLTKWQGPYTISWKVGTATYEIATPERPKQMVHVNLLKEWRCREGPPQQQLFVRSIEKKN